MYVHIGDDAMVPLRDLVVIIDSRNMAKGQINSAFLAQAEAGGLVEHVGEGEIGAYVVTTRKVIATAISAQTLRKRVEGDSFDIDRPLA